MKCTHPIRVGYAERPCGQCRACRINYASMWAVRCVLESLGYKDNVFLTLTYDDAHLPQDKSVKKEVMQKFMKRFRKSIYPAKARFFLCGEYGSKNKRPHYHLLIFGVGLKDPVFENLSWDYGHQGFWCTCKAWKDEKGQSLGNCFVGHVSIASAQYVAQYVLKKFKGKGAEKHYADLGVSPEFCLSSRRPGIGLGYFDRHRDSILAKGYISIGGSRYPLPRYFNDKLKENVPFYELLQSGLSLDNAQESLDRFAQLYEDLDDPYTYLQDEKRQRDLNIQKQSEVKGALNA